MESVADPGGPPVPVKTSPKKMAAAPRRKFRESSAALGQISGSATGNVETPAHCTFCRSET